MPSTYSVSIFRPWLSSTVTTPSLPTLSMTWAIMSPISVSRALMAAMWAMSSVVSTGLVRRLISSTIASTPFVMPRFRPIGLAPAVTFFRPSVMMAWASTIEVVVPSPATSLVFVATSSSSWAPMFS